MTPEPPSKKPHAKETASTIPAPPDDALATTKAVASNDLGDDEHALSLGSCLLSSGSGNLEPEKRPSSRPKAVAVAENALLISEFDDWWIAYGRIGSKADAKARYLHWRRQGATAAELQRAATRYLAHCANTDTFAKHAATFLSKKPNRWQEWLDEDHGDNDPRRHAQAARSAQVLSAAADVFGVDLRREVPDGSHQRHSAPGATAPLGLPAPVVD